jgi:hypothetical protein
MTRRRACASAGVGTAAVHPGTDEGDLLSARNLPFQPRRPACRAASRVGGGSTDWRGFRGVTSLRHGHQSGCTVEVAETVLMAAGKLEW